MLRAFITTVAVALPVAPALACGGFFCNNQVPVDQSGEQIVFGVDGDQVEVHVRIQYTGPSEAFSWVLPLPAEPEVALGTQRLFDLLESPTRPVFRSNWQQNPDCPIEDFCFSGAPSADATSAPDTLSDAGASAEDGVVVLQSGSVGPFDYHVIEAAEGTPAIAVFDWLDANDYDQPEVSQPLIEYYAAINFKFVAVKLQKDQPVGAIRPLRLSYTSPTYACIPLRLTSIAATDDMPVRAWILAKARAVPINYFNVTINPAAYPWLRCGQPTGPLNTCAFSQFQPQTCGTALTDLVTAAADQAGGRAFVTEFAGATPASGALGLTNGLPGDKWDSWTSLPAKDFISTVLQAYGPDPEALAIYTKHIPPADDAPANCRPATMLYLPWGGCEDHWPTELDRESFRADLEAAIDEPREAAKALLESRPYTTRLFTTVSPEEMTLDPLFSFNPDLPDVDTNHTITIKPYCNAAGEPSGATLEFPSGGSLKVPGSWDGGFTPVADPTENQDAAGQIQVMNESGGPVVVAESEIFQRQIEIEGRGPSEGRSDVESDPMEAPTEPTGLFGEGTQDEIEDPRPQATGSSGGGCSSGGEGSPAGLAILLVVLMWGVLTGRRALGR